MRAVLGVIGLSVLIFANIVEGVQERGRAVCTEGSEWHQACNQDRDNTQEAGVQGTSRSLSITPPGTECQATADATDRWSEGCNWCWCSESGVATCTRRGCSPAINEHLEGTKECKGHPHWKNDCKWCNCNNGRASCTKMMCEPSSGAEGTHSAVATRSGIIPIFANVTTSDSSPTADSSVDDICRVTGDRADRWRDGCKWCRCLNGKGACNKRGCPPALVARLAGTKECEGNAQWRRDCNWCRCNNETAVCTRRACLNLVPVTPVDQEPESEVEPECVAGSSWPDSCNSCRCSGGVSVCTRRACLRGSTRRGEAVAPDMNRPQVQDRPRGAAVAPDMSRPQVQDRPRITDEHVLTLSPSSMMLPIVLLSAIGDRISLPVDNRECVPGSRVMLDGCNWCSCHEHGSFACTLRACFAPRDPALKMCEEGSRWRNECNWCDCVNGQGICTQLDCFAGSNTLLDRPPLVVPAVHPDARFMCGVPRILDEQRVEGGRRSPIGKWPWLAPIFRRYGRKVRYLCGGSLVSASYVLTAAHCVKYSNGVTFNAQRVIVRLGDHNIFSNKDDYLVDPQTYSVAEIRPHPDYQARGHYNDIALLKLSKQVDFSDYIAPICLPSPDDMALPLDFLAGKSVTVVGYGRVHYQGRISPVPRETTMTVWKNSVCDSAYLKPITDVFLCANGVFKDACRGDSGGPLLYYAPSQQWVQVGIVSSGFFCAQPRYPGIYTRVTVFLDWIYWNMFI